MIKKEEVFKIGRFAKPHGIKGEIALVMTSETCDLFEESEDPYVICEMDGILVPFFIENYRYKSDTIILVKLELIDTEEQARAFTNKDVYFALDEMDEDFFSDDLDLTYTIGYELIDQKQGSLGIIMDIDTSTINQLFQVDHQGKELLVPAAEELITMIDHIDKRVTVALPDGLLDL